MPEPSELNIHVPILIPTAEAAPETGESLEELPRDYVSLPPNLAGNMELVRKFSEVAAAYYRIHWQQPERITLRENMKSADAMYRASKRRNRTTNSDQQQDTLSNVSSTAYYDSIRVTTAGQRAVMFYGEDLPAKYESVQKSPDYSDEEGQRVAEHQNLLFKYYWDKCGYESTLKAALLFNNKYSQDILCMEWDYRTSRRVERVPGFYNKAGDPVEFDPTKPEPMFDVKGQPILDVINPQTGRPTHFVFVEKLRIERDEPCLERVDSKDLIYDMQIDDLDNQNCIHRMTDAGLGELYQGQRDGLYMNVGAIGAGQLGQSTDTHDLKEKSDRHANADERWAITETGNLRLFHVWMRAPIDDESTKKKSDASRGKWDSAGIAPEWYKAVFVGRPGELATQTEEVGKDTPRHSGPVCLELRRNPYHNRRQPYKKIHSHMDDKGAAHMGYQSLLECLYEEDTAATNQLFDNRNLAVYKPWIAEQGNLLSRNMKFKQGNQVFWVKPGTGKTALTQLDVSDMTATMLPQLELISRRFDKTAGTDKAIAGEYAGSRTTGTEVLTVQQQAMKPALEDAEYIADQIFPWLLATFESRIRQFGDPSRELAITHENVIENVNPANLYGETCVRVVSVGQFETDLQLRQSVNNFIAAGYDKAAPFMGKEGALRFWQMIFKMMKFPGYKDYFPASKTREAENQAYTENMLALNDPSAALQDMPHEDENHDVHIQKHSEFKENYVNFTPPERVNPQTVQILDGWIAMHKRMQAAETSASPAAAALHGPQAGAPQNQADVIPAQAGEASGDAMAGALAGGNGGPIPS